MKNTRIQINFYLFENEMIFIFMNTFESFYFRMYDLQYYFRMYDLQYFKAILRYGERVERAFNERKIQDVMIPLGRCDDTFRN
jgi:hypothetical protein